MRMASWLWQIPKVFDLLQSMEQVQVILEGKAKLLGENRKPRNGDQRRHHFSITKYCTHLGFR